MKNKAKNLDNVMQNFGLLRNLCEKLVLRPLYEIRNCLDMCETGSRQEKLTQKLNNLHNSVSSFLLILTQENPVLRPDSHAEQTDLADKISLIAKDMAGREEKFRYAMRQLRQDMILENLHDMFQLTADALQISPTDTTAHTTIKHVKHMPEGQSSDQYPGPISPKP